MFSLKQDQLTTQLTLTPVFGEFPDNALLVVQVTNNIQDFGGNALVPNTFSFVTENRPVQTSKKTFEFTTDFPNSPNLSTGDVNSARSPSKAQGWLLFAGDGDNGANVFALSAPSTANGPAGVRQRGLADERREAGRLRPGERRDALDGRDAQHVRELDRRLDGGGVRVPRRSASATA